MWFLSSFVEHQNYVDVDGPILTVRQGSDMDEQKVDQVVAESNKYKVDVAGL